MSFYNDRILPSLIHLSMRQQNFSTYRRRVIPNALGRVLEIGAGSGLNFPFYGSAIERLVALDPSHSLLKTAKEATRASPLSVELIRASSEAIPLPDRSIDTIVSTWTLCTIPDVERALNEMRRVLKPEGHLLFVEHERSPDAAVNRWQNRLTPLWKRVGGGCRLNRPIADLIKGAGFRIDRLETGYMNGPKPLTFIYEGSAAP